MDNTNISQYILAKNNQYIVAYKPAGMPCVQDKSSDPHLQGLIEAYSKHPVHILTRVDRPVSGLVLFAKSKNAATSLALQLQNDQIHKYYIAIVEGQLPSENGTLIHYLHKKGSKSVVVDENNAKAKKAELHYRRLSQLDNYTIALVQLKTGRFHQIRCQMAHIGCPIKGDNKYGARRKNKDRSIHLHAYGLSFKHPVTKSFEHYTHRNNEQDALWNLVPQEININHEH